MFRLCYPKILLDYAISTSCHHLCEIFDSVGRDVGLLGSGIMDLSGDWHAEIVRCLTSENEFHVTT
jgi:hypothetical protein